MNKSYKIFSMRAVVLLALVVFFVTSAQSSEYRKITILHTNDNHGHLIPFSIPDPENPNDPSANLLIRDNIGGIARRAAVANQIREEMRGNVLMLDAGDDVDGTPFSIEYRGEADFAAMSAAGYDAMVVGNHEFSADIDQFYRNVHTADFPVLGANVVRRSLGGPALPAYVIFETDGVKIAVLGITQPMHPGYPAVRDDLDFTQPIDTANLIIPELRKKADIVVVVTHMGYTREVDLVKHVPGIDVLVGGHTHTWVLPPTFIPNGGDDPFSVNGTIVTQAYQFGIILARLDLYLRRAEGGPWTVMGYYEDYIPITSGIPDDPVTAKVVAKYYKPMKKKYDRVVGEAEETFYNSGTDNSLVNLTTDAMREATGADVAIYNDGSIRSDLMKGPIKFWDVSTFLGFVFKLVEVDVTGKQLKDIAMYDYKTTNRYGFSGMRTHIKDGKLVEITVSGKPVADDQMYKVATTDYHARLMGYEIKKVYFEDFRDPVTDYIKKLKVISPVLDNRRVIE